jgi:excisionase family DNA binding protein
VTSVDIHGAAALLHVHWQTVLDYIDKGILPAAKIGRAWVLLEKDVINYLATEVQKQTALRIGKGGQPRTKRAKRAKRKPQLA